MVKKRTKAGKPKHPPQFNPKTKIPKLTRDPRLPRQRPPRTSTSETKIANQIPLPRTQAQRIYDRFGGAVNLFKAISQLPEADRRTIGAVYAWNRTRERGGAGGVIPSHVIPVVIKAAQLEGILLTADDLYPGVR